MAVPNLVQLKIIYQVWDFASCYLVVSFIVLWSEKKDKASQTSPGRFMTAQSPRFLMALSAPLGPSTRACIAHIYTLQVQCSSIYNCWHMCIRNFTLLCKKHGSKAEE